MDLKIRHVLKSFIAATSTKETLVGLEADPAATYPGRDEARATLDSL